ncbi:GNAT family N-acetyltransferase [Undibacterium sp. CY7W]|uniref:GNAT family N-acetyltransferase n=1 Tax=Undibacterium rugosum TaxID=2762291 RepID=A0A923I0P4_9BURK|nr:GNAT family N-acetyltransferase [Undibacterium rugosum]MBC3934317.1 GNAT family N-acetyltransferase [Undibacterium rugosum]
MMTAPQILVADVQRHQQQLMALHEEYLGWVFSQLALVEDLPASSPISPQLPLQDYLPTALAAVCTQSPPQGIFYLLQVDGHSIGMGGLRGLSTELAELKRVYLRPAYRRLGLADSLMQTLLADARAFGYTRLCLDSAVFMQPAQRLYRRYGFEPCPPYAGTEVPVEWQAHWCFMQRSLAD